MVDYSYSEDGMPIPKQKGAFSQPFASEKRNFLSVLPSES
jgi:hypothetical protein